MKRLPLGAAAGDCMTVTGNVTKLNRVSSSTKSRIVPITHTAFQAGPCTFGSDRRKHRHYGPVSVRLGDERINFMSDDEDEG